MISFKWPVLIALLSAALQAWSENPNTNSPVASIETKGATNQTTGPGLSSEADKAWKDLEKAFRPPSIPPEWQLRQPTVEEFEAFRAERARLAGQSLNKAREFWTQFPNDPRVADARKKAENLHFAILMEAAQHAFTIQTPMERITKVPEQEKAARDLIQEFPQRREGYEILLQLAAQTQSPKAIEWAEQIVASPAPDELKVRAKGILWKKDALGKPVPIAFTALDGREVDVTKLQGKVVLIDFWATWCGPCMAELPNVKAAYNNLHGKGFEIVGISLDSDKEQLRNFLQTDGVKWPQYCDSKKWESRFVVQFGIGAIPTMWLVDKKGVLRDMTAMGGLEEKVEKLLAE
jgi:thiol-disulfide isomerase/thioredoxin